MKITWLNRIYIYIYFHLVAVLNMNKFFYERGKTSFTLLNKMQNVPDFRSSRFHGSA